MLAALFLFALGVALGTALEENRSRPATTTFERTLRPATVLPQRETVTVTTTVTEP